MLEVLSKISNSKRSLLFIVFILVMTIVFETSQQLFYIRRFDLNQATFLGLLKAQAFRWLVWTFLSFPLIWYSYKMTTKKHTNSKLYYNYALVILGLVFLNIIIIAIGQISINNQSITLERLFNDYITFYIFQKVPIYSLGYIAIAIISHLYFVKEQMQIKIESLIEVKKTNLELYKKLSQNMDDKASVLNIKIGNKRKIIPVENICWIEADDYCVKVHTSTDNTYTMRISLKALEEKLSTKFLRVHRKAIVNMSLVKELHTSGAPTLVLENEIQIPVSKSNLKIVRDFLN